MVAEGKIPKNHMGTTMKDKCVMEGWKNRVHGREVEAKEKMRGLHTMEKGGTGDSMAVRKRYILEVMVTF